MADTFYYAGYAFASTDHALVCLTLDASADPRRRLTIKKFEVRLVAAGSPTSGDWLLVRTSTQTGGDPIPIVVATSASAALPSQVSLALYPNITTATTIRSLFPIYVTLPNLGLTTPGMGAVGAGLRQDTGTLFDAGFAGSGTQSFAIREGEGCAIVPADPPGPINLPVNIAHYCQLTFAVRATGATYLAAFHLVPTTSGLGSFGLFNSSGSGVVLDVQSFSVSTCGPFTLTNELLTAPYVRFARVSGRLGGEAVTITARDTSTTAPSEMTLRRGQVWAPLVPALAANRTGFGIAELNYPAANVNLARKIGTFSQTLHSPTSQFGPNSNAIVGSDWQPNTPQHGRNFTGESAITGIEIHPGEGFAALVNNATDYQAYWTELEWTHTPPPAGGGGQNVFSVLE